MKKNKNQLETNHKDSLKKRELKMAKRRKKAAKKKTKKKAKKKAKRRRRQFSILFNL